LYDSKKIDTSSYFLNLVNKGFETIVLEKDITYNINLLVNRNVISLEMTLVKIKFIYLLNFM
jgi:hypothetical protein